MQFLDYFFIVIFELSYNDLSTFHLPNFSCIGTDRLEKISLITMTPKAGILSEWN